jgi:diphosphomevalonate decarboxylase
MKSKSTGTKTTVRVGSNIAFIKYWGVIDEAINIPLSNSISMTLADAHTTTTVEWDHGGALDKDIISLDGKTLDDRAALRLVRHLDRLRGLAGVDYRASVASMNNFPMASGIASSASGFAALTVAGCAALGLDYDNTRLSAIARQGSGSASRSLFGGFVEWDQGTDDTTSVARQIYPRDHWALYDVVAVISSAEKRVSSENGHKLAETSPLNTGRIGSLDKALAEVRQAIDKRDIAQLGPVIEEDTLAMHGVMMTGRPSLLYWEPATIGLMKAVRTWREDDGLQVYFTIDAGPNIHLICEQDTVKQVNDRLASMPDVERIIISRPGPGPEFLDEDLF